MMRRLSIKSRLTIGVTLTSVLLTGVAVIVILLAIQNILLSDAWATLEDMARDASDEVEIDDGEVEIDDDIVYYRDGVTVVVCCPDGVIVGGRLPITFPEELPLSVDERRQIDSAAGRWLVKDVFAEDGMMIRAVMSLNEIDSTMRQMTGIAVLAYLGYALLMAWGSYRLAALAFRPIDQINRRAEEIRTGNDLSVRIPVPETKDEIADLAENFNEMFKRLGASFEKERRFTADASHDLRTPLAVILSESEYALADPESDREAALLTIHERAARMSDLVNGLLMLSRADEGKAMARERVDLSELTELVSEEMRDVAQEDGVGLQIEVEPGLFVMGDETMLMRVLINLIENAVRYRDAVNPEPRVDVKLKKEEDWAVLTVADNGIGIAPEHLEKIWERFYRVDAVRSFEQSGAGLGLALVKAIVERHGGAAQVVSELGAGTEFRLRFPRAE